MLEGSTHKPCTLELRARNVAHSNTELSNEEHASSVDLPLRHTKQNSPKFSPFSYTLNCLPYTFRLYRITLTPCTLVLVMRLKVFFEDAL
jgi:hypothetical protein